MIEDSLQKYMAKHARYLDEKTSHITDPEKRERSRRCLARAKMDVETIVNSDPCNAADTGQFDGIPIVRIDDFKKREKDKIDRLKDTPIFDEKIKPPLTKMEILNQRGKFGQTPVCAAVVRGDYDEVEKLCKMGVDLDIQDNLRMTPLERARNQKDEKMIELLTKYMKRNKV